MTIQMNIAEAKARLSELVARAEAGEEVVIARDGKPIVALTPRGPGRQGGRRRLGLWEKHCAAIPEDAFLGPDAEVEAAIEAWRSAPIEPAG